MGEKTVEALVILLSVLSKGKKRTKQYKAIAPPPVPPTVLDNPACAILNAFVTYPIGQQARKVYKKVVQRKDETESMTQYWRDFLILQTDYLQKATPLVDDGAAVAACLALLDTKLVEIKDEDRLIVTESLTAEGQLMMGACVDMVFRDLLDLIVRYGKDISNNLIGTDAAVPESMLLFTNFQQGAIALNDSKEIRKAPWALDQDCLENIKHMMNLSNTIPDLATLGAEDGTIREAAATRINRVITTMDFTPFRKTVPYSDRNREYSHCFSPAARYGRSSWKDSQYFLCQCDYKAG